MAFVALSSVQSPAIENLKLSITGSNVRLTWSSRTGETFVVQYKPTLQTNDSWQTLTNLMPSATGTNRTTFVHSGAYQCSGGSAAMMASGTGSQGTASFSAPQSEATLSVLQESRSVRIGRLTAEIVASQQRAPYPWEIGERPPYPWEANLQPPTDKRTLGNQAGDESTTAQLAAAVETGGAQTSSLQANGSPSCLGFYRVVRNGIYFFGITNGTVFSGQAVLPIEAGVPSATTLDAIYVNQGSNPALSISVPGMEITGLLEGLPRAIWNTSLIPNGTYQLNLGGTINNVTDVPGSSVTVVVSNQVWFPDPFQRAGYYLEVQAQSIHANGSYHVDIYDDTGFAIVNLNGPIDSQGYITYQGVRGFLIENYDPITFEVYPGLYYQIVVATSPGGGGFNAAASQTAVNTNFVWVERPWPTNTFQNLYTQFAIAYQPIYGDPSSGASAAVTLQSMMQVVYTAAETRAGNLGVVRGGSQDPFELLSQFDFTRLLRDFRVEEVRNLYYFGHGNPDFIGQKSLGKYIDTGNIYQFLNNQGDPTKPFTLTNAHPFRFVFLDGCSTADGGMCSAFGIPKVQNMSAGKFANKGVRFRAFLGWNNKQLIGFANSINTSHTQFVGEFYSKWGLPDDNGNFLNVRQAITAAPSWSQKQYLIIYGYEGLLFNDTLP